ncbi:ABC transporter permease [Egicoccus sp. AB-alg6-2]|uniref:ABC transporter permease n=1 Tax=Egicoccus sp. AB-alg6-2 TaxID=3242692 RepID=UPI00359DD317
MSLETPFDEPAGRRLARAASGKLVELWRARELLLQLVRKELKVRYKNSALGFLWSMITPVLMTIVFSVVFTVVVPIPVDDFPAFFVAGYLLWQFFQNSCRGGTDSIVGNGDLVKKVYFPREVLPLSHVLSQLVHLLLALLVISPFLIYFRGWGLLVHLPATLLAVVLLTVFTSGAAMWFAGVNVVFRDLQELFIVIFQVWFYATPVLYPLALVQASPELERRSLDWIATALTYNPMTWFVEVFREPLYGPVIRRGVDDIESLAPAWPSVSAIGIAALWALGAFVFGYAVFLRRARTFAKEV